MGRAQPVSSEEQIASKDDNNKHCIFMTCLIVACIVIIILVLKIIVPGCEKIIKYSSVQQLVEYLENLSSYFISFIVGGGIGASILNWYKDTYKK